MLLYYEPSFIPDTDKLYPRYLNFETCSIMFPFIIVIFARSV
jgi:hypothetical protein